MITPQPKEVSDVNTQYTTLDIETRRSGKILAIGLAYYEYNDRRYEVFYSWEACIAFLLRNGRKNKSLRTIYAHNGANFDWLSLLDTANSSPLIELDKVKIIHSNGSGIGINIKIGKNGTLKLRDSLRLMPASLKKLSATLSNGAKKLDIDIHPEDLYETQPDLFYEYLHADCFALQDILSNFHQLINERIGVVERLPMTMASLSLTVWRDNYLPYEILTTWNKKQKQLEQDSYAGGRVEVFKYGEYDNVNVYDVNSEYPAVMVSNVFPISYKGYWSKEYEAGALGIYRVEFTQTNTDLPPVLMVNGRGAYSGAGTYCSPELDKLMEVGGTFTVDEGFIYVDVGNPFSEYIKTMYALRLEAQKNKDEGLAYVTKLLMNSLYGKFGQKDDTETIALLTGEEISELMDAGATVTEYGNYCTIKEAQPVEHAFFALASFITCYARVTLYGYMQAAGAVVYTDTDSVHTLNELPAQHIGNDLGKMKLEYSGKAVYAGKKLYALAHKVKAKGVSVGGNNGDQGINYDTIKQLATVEGAAYNARFTSPPTLKEVVLHNKPSSVWYERRRTIRRT